MFVLILDGLDEVEHDARQEVSDQIANLREAYPNLGIVISSRPDHRLEAWSDFEIYRIQSMRKDQVKALLSKLPWDPEVRTRFIEEVDKHLYAKHENFLSNPLLATMMLMTFDQYANIPDKMHIFYDHAFQTLFDRHDAGKQGWYGRKNYTLLDINQFKNCLSALCIHSYDFKKLLFSEAEILEYISIAVEQEGLDVKPRDYLSDLLESTCVLQRDGLYITFTHRSFQEYFAAYYLSRSPSFPIAEALDDFCKRTSDNVIWMAWDMNSGVLEREWVLPRTTDLAQKLRRCDYQNNMMEILSALELRFRVSNILDDRNRELTLQMTGSGRDLFITFLKMYAKIFEPVNLLFEGVGNSKRDAGIVGRAWERRRSTAIELGSSDHEWVVNTTIGELIVEIRNTILRLAETVEASVGKKKGERFYKKHGGELEKN